MKFSMYVADEKDATDGIDSSPEEVQQNDLGDEGEHFPTTPELMLSPRVATTNATLHEGGGVQFPTPGMEPSNNAHNVNGTLHGDGAHSGGDALLTENGAPHIGNALNGIGAPVVQGMLNPVTDNPPMADAYLICNGGQDVVKLEPPSMGAFNSASAMPEGNNQLPPFIAEVQPGSSGTIQKRSPDSAPSRSATKRPATSKKTSPVNKRPNNLPTEQINLHPPGPSTPFAGYFSGHNLSAWPQGVTAGSGAGGQPRALNLPNPRSPYSLMNQGAMNLSPEYIVYVYRWNEVLRAENERLREELEGRNGRNMAFFPPQHAAPMMYQMFNNHWAPPANGQEPPNVPFMNNARGVNGFPNFPMTPAMQEMMKNLVPKKE